MQTVGGAYAAELAKGAFAIRYFVWLTAFDRTTGAEVGDGMWSGDGDLLADIYNPDTQMVETRNFHGVGRAFEFSDVAKVADMTVQSASIDFSAAVPEVQDMIRAYDLRFGRCEMYRGLANIATGQLVGPAEPRFFGFVSDVELTLPASGRAGSAVIEVRSQSWEFRSSNPERRSVESQRRRDPSDNLYVRANAAAEVPIYWGRKKP